MILCDLFENKLVEYSMSEMASFLDDLSQLESARVILDSNDSTVHFKFIMHGQHGSATFRARPDNGIEPSKVFRSKVYAAAISTMSGSIPKTWDEVISAFNGNIRNRAIKILSNPKSWRLIGMKYDGMTF